MTDHVFTDPPADRVDDVRELRRHGVRVEVIRPVGSGWCRVLVHTMNPAMTFEGAPVASGVAAWDAAVTLAWSVVPLLAVVRIVSRRGVRVRLEQRAQGGPWRAVATAGQDTIRGRWLPELSLAAGEAAQYAAAVGLPLHPLEVQP